MDRSADSSTRIRPNHKSYPHVLQSFKHPRRLVYVKYGDGDAVPVRWSGAGNPVMLCLTRQGAQRALLYGAGNGDAEAVPPTTAQTLYSIQSLFGGSAGSQKNPLRITFADSAQGQSGACTVQTF